MKYYSDEQKSYLEERRNKLYVMKKKGRIVN